MANIPVEKTNTGVPPWLWILGLLLLALLAWFVISALGDDEEVVVNDPIETVDPIVTSPAPAALDLSNLYVTRVTGDQTFYVAPSENDTANETLVILDETASPGTPGIEGQVDINPGQRVSLAGGRMEALGDVNLAGMGLSDADANAVTPATEVIRVAGTSVEVLDAPMGVNDVEVGT